MYNPIVTNISNKYGNIRWKTKNTSEKLQAIQNSFGVQFNFVQNEIN
ncbi:MULTISPECIES: hypothetical protein [unclassified Lysinibacillus]|nr:MULTISPECIES: hypothetical protein [unclassified Lysinibacillus]MDM5248464.1 hypothetical protein [Lysinibacillus sp. G4S2]